MFDFEFLKATEDYTKVFQTFPFPVVLCDTKFQVYWSNPIAKANYEMLTNTELLHQFLAEYDLSDLSATIYEQGEKTIAGIIPLNTMRLHMTPLVHKGEHIGIIMVLTQPEDEPSLIRLQEMSTATSVFANDVRGTVSGIFSSMDAVALKAELLNADWIMPHLTNIATDSYQILRLADNMTKFARFRNQDAHLTLTSFNIFGWLRHVEDGIRLTGSSLGIPIQFEIEEADEYLSLDIKQFESAFFNVLHNAFYFTKPDNEVLVTAQSVPAGVEIIVQDKGIGIEESYLSKIYSPFFSHLPKGFKPNLGLGLTIAHLVFAAHEGSILVESTPNKGTTVTMFLPYPKATAPLHLTQGEEDYIVCLIVFPLFM